MACRGSGVRIPLDPQIDEASPLGGASSFHPSGAPRPSASLWQDNEHVKIVSLNLRGFFDWNTRLPSIMNYLAREKPDLVLCQEVVFLPDISPLSNLDVLNRVSGFPHRHSALDRLR